MGANTSKPPVPAPAGASAQTNIRNSGKAPWWNVLGVTKRNSVNSGGPKNTNRGPAPMPAPVPPPAPMPVPVPAAAVGGRRKKKASRLSKKRSSKKRASRKSRS